MAVSFARLSVLFFHFISFPFILILSRYKDPEMEELACCLEGGFLRNDCVNYLSKHENVERPPHTRRTPPTFLSLWNLTVLFSDLVAYQTIMTYLQKITAMPKNQVVI